jgi:HTH-type transcriptional regulator/antitoxin HipB
VTYSGAPQPAICGHRQDGATCGFDLSAIQPAQADRRLLEAQGRVWELVAARDRQWLVARSGGGGPVSPLRPGSIRGQGAGQPAQGHRGRPRKCRPGAETDGVRTIRAARSTSKRATRMYEGLVSEGRVQPQVHVRRGQAHMWRRRLALVAISAGYGTANAAQHGTLRSSRTCTLGARDHQEMILNRYHLLVIVGYYYRMVIHPGEEYVVSVPSDLGAAIKRYRRAKGVTQQQAAELEGVGQSYLSALEGGKFGSSLRHALRLLRLLGFEVVVRPMADRG